MAANIREHSLSVGERYLIGDALGLYSAVVFGDKSRLSQELKSDLSVSGLSHIAAVSGMHLSVIWVIIMFLLSLLFGKRRLTGLLTIPAMIFFALITGGEPSVVRACIMCSVFQLSKILYRDNDSLSAVSLAFLVMCGYNPMLIYSTGFQLSLAATIGIILFSETLMRPVRYIARREVFTLNLPLTLVGKLIHGILSIVVVSLSAQLATLPIIIYVFRSISAYALLSNLLVVPLLPFIMAAGLLLAILGSVTFLAKPIAAVCGFLLNYVAFAAKTIARLPGAAIPVSSVNIPIVIAHIALVLTMLALVKKKRLVSLFLAVVFVSASVVGSIQMQSRRSISELCFLNVGRADCALFNLSGKAHVLIDGGRSGGTVSNYLEARGIFTLDCAVVTANKIEHISGLIELVDSGAVKSLYIPAELEMSDRLETLMLAAEDAEVPVHKFSVGSSIYVGGLTLRALDCDAASAQLLAEYKGKRILFCGDDMMEWADCDIVKMPSHGSGSYNYYGELHRHQPTFAVMTAAGGSAMENSNSAQVIKYMDIPCYIPSICGTVTFDLSGEEIAVTTTEDKY